MDSLVEVVRKAGLRVTPQRIEIVRAIMDIGHEHPSLNELYNVVRNRLPTISFSTLYTTLKKLEEIGLIRTFDLNGETRIEVNNKPHINIINVGENSVKDIIDEEILEILKKKLGIRSDKFLVNILIYNNH